MAQQNLVQVYHREFDQMQWSCLATLNLEMGEATLRYQQVSSAFSFTRYTYKL